MSAGSDVIFVSMEDWDDVWRRNQFVCAELSRRHPAMKILFVGLALDVSNSVRKGRVTNLMLPPANAVSGFPNITVVRPLKLLPNTLAVGRRVNEHLFRRPVWQAARTLGLREPVLWLNPHYARHMVGRMGERGVVYDITDDWTTLTQSPRLAKFVAEQDADLCRRADATIVCSERLHEMKRPLARSLHLIPNGVDAAHYRQVTAGSGPLPAVAAAWERPVFGYTGTIHPDRVDVDLVQAVARRLARGTIALVGPDLLRPEDRARLAATGRVAVTGPVPYREVPQWMRAFDVSVTPHRVTPFTESLNPIKLWEYLAAGKPIVSTPVAGFRDYPALVRIAAGADAFLAACEAAVAQGHDPAAVAARRAAVEGHSWEARVDVIERVLAQVAQGSDRTRTTTDSVEPAAARP